MEHVKDFSQDGRSQGRIRFASAKKRAKSASADVYRNYKRKTGVAASREERVHHVKRQRKSENDNEELAPSTLAEELDLANDRNASEVFGKFYRQVWYLVRSLPEILHHSDKIVNLFNQYMLSIESKPHEMTPDDVMNTNSTTDSGPRAAFVTNHATADILHLYAVLARDLRHEIHPYLHTKIVPRLLNDLLNPPPPESGKQPIPLDVSVVEHVFRTLSYIFRYDGDALLAENNNDKEPCLESLRQYYGSTLANRRQLVRRLAAETYAPLIRKLSDRAQKRHVRRVLRALAGQPPHENNPVSQRLQADAVDGIALLCFQLARGVPGKMHSKGQLVVKCVLDACASKLGPNSELVKDVTATLLERLCYHLDTKDAAKIMVSVIAKAKAVTKDDSGSIFERHFIELLEGMVNFRTGQLLKEEYTLVDKVIDLLVIVLDKEYFRKLPTENKTAAISLLCSSWKAVPNNSAFSSRLREQLRFAIAAHDEKGDKLLVNAPLDIVMKDLVPALPVDIAMGSIGSVVLNAASDVSKSNPQLAIAMIYALSSTRIDADAMETEQKDDDDGLLFLENAEYCVVSSDNKEKLLKLCMNSSDSIKPDSCAIAAKTACFVAMVPENEEDNDVTGYDKQVSKWLLSLLKKLSNNGAIPDSNVVSVGIIMDALAQFCLVAAESIDDKSRISDVLKKARTIAVENLQSHSDSLWTVKSSAALVKVLQKFDLLLTEDSNKLFEMLTPNLHDKNHFHRLRTLEILSSFPKKPFVMDHADLDLTEDLDEEPSSGTPADSAESKGPMGVCNIIDTLIAIESTPVYFSRERYITSLVSRVEVMGRSGKLPVLYAEAAASHMLGILNIKFAPIWSAAVKALVGLARGHESSVWPPAHARIAALMTDFPYRDEREKMTEGTGVSLCDPLAYHMLCVQWETSGGNNASVFSRDIENANEEGRVSRHRSTDEPTVLESLWKVFEEAPQLLVAHSRTMVPIILQFLHCQYFALHPEDPDARELKLSEHVDDPSKPDIGKEVDRGAIHRRLLSILKAFSAVAGPQQLFKHKLLNSIFTALLGHPDPSVAQLALSCVLRFKPEYLLPYAETLKKFYAKGKLREALLQLRTDDEEGRIVPNHRSGLLPALSRILFGRLSARAMEGRSSKDTPSARRSAVLSFLSSFSKEEDEIYPFIYLAVRPYLPQNQIAMAMESQDPRYRSSLVSMVKKLTVTECERVPRQVHQGFLNTLEAIVAQLGHSAKNFLPAFMTITLTLTDLYEVKDCQKPETKDSIAVGDDNEDVQWIPQERGNSIRGACYRRLAEIYDTFGDAVDLGSYSGALWRSVEKSLKNLPIMAANAEKAPALLGLLKVFSSKPKLVEILTECDEAVPSVLKCFTARSGMSVVDACLTFIDNLLSGFDLSNGSHQNSLGCVLVKRHVGLLLKQFRHRLGDSKGLSLTWRRELAILCRVSELIENGSNQSDSDVAENAESLCSLLIPFLDHGRKSSDKDKTNVLGIIDVLVPMVAPGQAVSHFTTLAKLLGPYKSAPGVTSKPVRLLLAGVLKTLAESGYPSARKVTSVLLDLCAVSHKQVDEVNFDLVIPALGNLVENSSSSSWVSLCHDDGLCDPSLLTPVIHCCFHLLFNEDGVVSRTAFRALKELAVCASEKSSGENSLPQPEKDRWAKLLEGCIVPLTRGGLNVRDSSIRRFFILILRELALANKDEDSPNLHGDLASLAREDEPDLDFFINITHVQIHRRSRALQRLRKCLESEEKDQCFRPQSLSHVLLPLSLHPVYETKSKSEESFALEGIATVGAIARYLSWSKYNNILWTTLTQFHRHPEQEPYLVSLICSLIDAFHFDIVMADAETQGTCAVWRALDKRFIPKIEELLVKEKVDRHGDKIKMLRPSIVLAMQKLFAKLPAETFRLKLPRILAVICDALRSRDSDARDVARKTLAKIAVDIDIVYLADIVRELAITLTVGYQLHVRSATVHTILLKLSEVYTPPLDGGQKSALPFDSAVPALVDLIQQDLFGEAQARKDAEGNKVRYVKEAGGSKGTNSIELIASMIVFNPGLGPKSAIHTLVTPFIERLRTPALQSRVVRQIKDCLQKIVSGLQRNPTIHNEDILPYVYATVKPFVGTQEMNDFIESLDEESDTDESGSEGLKPLGVTGKKKTVKASLGSSGSVVEWRPSTLGTSKTAKQAQAARKKEVLGIRRVKDGSSAPKLTGSGRNGSSTSQSGVNDPANVSAVAFGLQLLSSFLRKTTTAPVDMLDPFVPLLTTCVCRCRDSEVILLSLKCLGSLLRSELPSLSRCSKSLASKTLDLLTSSGAASNLNPELLQASFKMLTYLMDYDRKYLATSGPSVADGHEHGDNVKGFALPLDPEQMQVLLSFLRSSLVDSNQHNPAIGLVKAIMTRQYISAEFYDLMDTLLELTVRSSKASLRDQSAAMVVSFLINYPLSDERLEQHLRQILLNLQYEYSEGRASAIALVKLLVDRFPLPVLEQHSELFFLPLSMQLINDDSEDCRENVAKTLARLFELLSTPKLQSLFEYTERWYEGKNPRQRQLALQLYGLFINCHDFMKRGNTAQSLLMRLDKLLGEGQTEDWEVAYFALLDLEKLAASFPELVTKQTSLWKGIVRTMATSQHAWVQVVSSRLVTQHLSSLDPMSFGNVNGKSSTFLLDWPGALYQVARNFCFQLGATEPADDLIPLAIKGLTWIAQAMDAFPELCFAEDDSVEEEDEDEPQTSGNTDKRKKPVLWLLTRLSNIAKLRGTKRRQAVFKCFASLATTSSTLTKSQQNLELILEPLLRSHREYKSREPQTSFGSNGRTIETTDKEEFELVQDVLALIEESSPDKVFLSAQTTVHRRARKKSDDRRLALKSEFILDPEKSAQRRIQKQEREKNRRKRRVDERRKMRGGVAKRRHVDT